jgi:hypothetical protein
MGIIGNFGQGARETVRVGRAIFVLWVSNVLFALLGVLPLAFLIHSALGHSVWGSQVRGFDFLWLGEALYKFRDLPPALAGGFLGAAGLFLLVSVFLNGGVVGRLAAGERVTPAGFFGDCGRFFWRFVRLFLLSLPVYIIVLALFSRLLTAALKSVTDNAPTEWTTIIVSNLQFLAVVLVFSIIQMLFDYTKVRLAVDDSYQVLRSLGRTVGFLLRNFGRTWGTYLLVSLFLVLGFAVFVNVLKLIPGRGLVPAVLGFLWSQAFVLFRLWTRVQYFATAFIIDRDRRR